MELWTASSKPPPSFPLHEHLPPASRIPEAPAALFKLSHFYSSMGLLENLIYFDLVTFLPTSLINFEACGRCKLKASSYIHSCILQFSLFAIYLFIKFYTISRGRLMLSHFSFWHFVKAFLIIYFVQINPALQCGSECLCGSVCVCVGECVHGLAVIKMAHIITKA